MGSTTPPNPKPIAPESGLEPAFHVTDVHFEISSDGSVLISLYEERRGELRLQATLHMMPLNVLKAARTASTIAAEAHNVGEWAMAAKDFRGGDH
jgi:hypothetical protein